MKYLVVYLGGQYANYEKIEAANDGAAEAVARQRCPASRYLSRVALQIGDTRESQNIWRESKGFLRKEAFRAKSLDKSCSGDILPSMKITFSNRKQRSTAGRGTNVHLDVLRDGKQVGQVWQERLYMQTSTDCGWVFQLDGESFDLAETLCGERTRLSEIRDVFNAHQRAVEKEEQCT